MSEETKMTPRKKVIAAAMMLLALILAAAAIYLLFAGRSSPTPDPTATENPERQKIVAAVNELLAQSGELGAAAAYVVLDQAESTMQAYLKLSPYDLEIQAMLADVYLRMAKLNVADRTILTQKAEATIDALLKAAPHSSQALWIKGQIEEFKGGKNFMHYYRTSADGPNATAEYRLKFARVLMGDERMGDRWKEAEKYLDKCVDAGMKNSELIAARADIAIYNGKTEDAMNLLREATMYDKTDATVWGRLAELQMKAGEMDTALATIEQGLKSCSSRNAGLLHFKRGELYAARKNWTRAAESFVVATEVESVSTQASLELAKCYNAMGDNRQAMKYLDGFLSRAYPDPLTPLPPEIQELKNRIEDARFGPVKKK